MLSTSDLLGSAALLLPIFIIVISLLPLIKFKKNKDSHNISLTLSGKSQLSDPSKNYTVTVFIAKKALKESVRLVLDRYRSGDSEIKNAPLEIEYLVDRLLLAFDQMESRNQTEVLSSLQTFSALGTQDLMIILSEDFDILEKKWKKNKQIVELLNATKQQMMTRLENPQLISVGNTGPETKIPVEVTY